MGLRLVYGLGTENQHLPGSVVVSPAAVSQAAQLWASSFLPSAYQGTLIRDLDKPLANLDPGPGGRARQRDKLDALRRFNELHQRGRAGEPGRVSAGEPGRVSAGEPGRVSAGSGQLE